MDEEKRKRLEASGWRVATVQEFLDLTDDEMLRIEHLVDERRSFMERFRSKVLSRPGAAERVEAVRQKLLNTPNKLWLDDLRPAPDDTWRTIKTAHEAIDWLQRSFFDVVSLDHDLGEPENGTGYDVLVWLERAVAEGDWQTELPEIQIHSANPVGRRNMVSAFEAITRIAATLPASQDDERIVDALIAKQRADIKTRPLRRRESDNQ